jgi:hypothetical protein
MKKRWKIWSRIGIPPTMMTPKLIESGITMKWLARRSQISIGHHLSNPRHVGNFHFKIIKSSKRRIDLGFSIQERRVLELLSNNKWMVLWSDGNCQLTSGYPPGFFFFFFFFSKILVLVPHRNGTMNLFLSSFLQENKFQFQFLNQFKKYILNSCPKLKNV